MHRSALHQRIRSPRTAPRCPPSDERPLASALRESERASPPARGQFAGAHVELSDMSKQCSGSTGPGSLSWGGRWTPGLGFRLDGQHPPPGSMRCEAVFSAAFDERACRSPPNTASRRHDGVVALAPGQWHAPSLRRDWARSPASRAPAWTSPRARWWKVELRTAAPVRSRC